MLAGRRRTFLKISDASQIPTGMRTAPTTESGAGKITQILARALRPASRCKDLDRAAARARGRSRALLRLWRPGWRSRVYGPGLGGRRGKSRLRDGPA